MKTIITGFVAIFLVLFSFSFALAENLSDNSSNENTPMLISAPVADDLSNVSDVSSGTVFWKGVGLWFTFNQEKKINKEMELAQLRLQQAEYTTSHNMTKAAEKALDSYQKLMNKIKKRNDLIDSKQGANANIVRLAAMDQAILVHQERISRLSALLENANLTEKQGAKLAEKISKIENETMHLQIVQSQKEDKIRTRLMTEGNLTEADAQVIIDNAKDNVAEIIGGAKSAWKRFKDEAMSQNKTPGEFAKERRQEFRDEVKNEVRNSRSKNSEGKGSNKSN